LLLRDLKLKKGGVEMSFPLKNDVERADQFFLDFLRSLMKNPETAAAWCGLGMVVGVKMQDLNLGYTIRCTPEGVIAESGYPENPDTGISFTSDTFHDLFTGEINAIMSLASGKISISGSTKNMLKLSNVLPQTYEVYEKYLKESMV